MAKKTPLYDDHVKLNAKIVEFSGWLMPVYYSTVIIEHNTTRNKVTIFDTSHMGEFLIEGKDSFNFIQNITTRDLSKLEDNRCFYTFMCNNKGGVIDDLFVYRFNKEKYILVVNAGTIEKDYKHILDNKSNFNVAIKNSSDIIAKLDIQGPLSEKLIQKFLKEDLSKLKRFNFIETKLNDCNVILSRSGYTGEDGFEIYSNNMDVIKLWNSLLEKGKEYGIIPAGLGARDTLRLESCYSLYGHELNEKISPIEAGLNFAVDLNKKDFIGKNELIEIKNNLKRISVAFELLERGIPREKYEVLKENKVIGYVSSGTMSPTLNKGIGMALIETDFSSIETEIDIKIRDKLYNAKIVTKPFYSFKGKNR
jgi:aminomethyltransferase